MSRKSMYIFVSLTEGRVIVYSVYTEIMIMLNNFFSM